MKSKLEKLNLFILVVFLSSVLLLIARSFIFAFVLFLFLVYFSVIWYKQLGEDLVIYTLKRNASSLRRDEILSRIGGSLSALKRLERKKIIEIKDNIVYLIDENYKIAFRDS